MKRSEDRILTTHVGSLIRSKELRAAAAARTSPENQQSYEDLLRRCVGDVVKMQAKAGIDIVDDGEFGKANWANYILDRVTGFELRPQELRPVLWLGRDLQRFPEVMKAEFPFIPSMEAGLPTRACVAPIQYRDTGSIQRDIQNLKAALKSVAVEEAFLPVVAPASAAYDGVNEYYSSEKEYVYAMADALRQEYRAIHESGLLLQVDDAVLANMYDHLVQKSPEDYRRWAGLRIEALNHALEGIPEDRVRYHVCFGSWHVPHVADAPLEEIVDLILSVKAGAYSIEAANPRHEHEWRVWESRKLPDGKILIPGVVTHHTITVEHPRLVADRILRFARIVGRENVIAGTDCGFAQTEMVQRVPPSVMWAKFEALIAGARLASQELWR
jgi:5-methyltetrahydropteroyltriglutamate--homocysteine methyltransferase